MQTAVAWDQDLEDEVQRTPEPTSIQCLLVDDDRFDRYNVRYAAERAGLNLTFFDASTAAEARRLINERRFGLIILDQNLPDGKGLELAVEIGMSTQNANTPTIMLTGLDDIRLAVGAQQAGCVEFLTKNDLNGSTLSTALRRALEKSVATFSAQDFPAASDAFEMMLAGFGEMYLAQTIKPALARILFLANQMERSLPANDMEMTMSVQEIGNLCRTIWTQIEIEEQRGNSDNLS